MEIVKVELECSKEAYELGQSISKLIESIKESQADGFQAAQDIPDVLVQNLNSLLQGIQGVEKIDDEAKADVEKFSNAIYCGLKPGVFGLIKK